MRTFLAGLNRFKVLSDSLDSVLESGLQLGLVTGRPLVMMVKVRCRGYGIHYVNECSQKDVETQFYVCAFCLFFLM